MKLIYEPVVTVIATTAPTIPLGESLISFAAKQSTQSTSTEDITKKLYSWGHLSVFEHISITLLIKGITRGLANELTRHRHLSFTQRSTRYCVQDSYVVPVEFRPNPPQSWIDDLATIDNIYQKYATIALSSGKQRLELAKQFVPNCAEASIVVTGNVRAWLEFLPKRLSKNASLEFQVVAKLIKEKILLQVKPYLGDEICLQETK